MLSASSKNALRFPAYFQVRLARACIFGALVGCGSTGQGEPSDAAMNPNASASPGAAPPPTAGPACPFALPAQIGAWEAWRWTDKNRGEVITSTARVEALEMVAGRAAARVANSVTSTMGPPSASTSWFSVDQNCAQWDYSEGAKDWYKEIDGTPSEGRMFMNSTWTACVWSRSAPITVQAGTFADCFELDCTTSEGARHLWYCAGASAVLTSDGAELISKSW